MKEGHSTVSGEQIGDGIFAPAFIDPNDPLKLAKFGDPGVEPAFFTDAWNVKTTTYTSYGLATASFSYGLSDLEADEYHTSGVTGRALSLNAIVNQSSSTTTGPYSVGIGAEDTFEVSGPSVANGQLEILNFNIGDFGISLPNEGPLDKTSTSQALYKVTQWNDAYIGTQNWSVPTNDPYPYDGFEKQYGTNAQGQTYAYVTLQNIIGSDPANLGKVISSSSTDAEITQGDILGYAADPSLDRTSLDITDFLFDTSDDTHANAFHMTLFDISSTDPVVTLTAEEAVQSDSNPSNYSIAIVDTVANVANYIDALSEQSLITSVTLTDVDPALLISSQQLLNNLALLRLIDNNTYSILLSSDSSNSLSLSNLQMVEFQL